ncbi:metalloregulator ArsR/SmtB family transcription factor [Lachnospiraceae bacterium JLR.KK008]
MINIREKGGDALREKDIRIEQCECTHTHAQLKEQVMRQMPEEEKLSELASFFKVFGDVTRIRILHALLCSEMCVCDMAQILDMTQSAISHQLRLLKQMALVKNRREGKTVFYSLSDGHIATILSQGTEHIEE